MCCAQPMGYIEYTNPLIVGGPANVLIIWCKGCGHILDGNGEKQPHGLKITEI